MKSVLGRPLQEALSSLPAGSEPPRITETAAPRRDGAFPRSGTLRVIACRQGEWVCARFADELPRQKEAL